MRGIRSRIVGLLAATFASLVVGQAAFAQSQILSTDAKQAKPSLISERAAVAPGDPFLIALSLKLEDTWHVYWQNPGDSGLPPTVKWKLPEGVTAGPFKWPAPEAIPLATLMNFGYEHELVLPMEIKVPANAKPGDKITLTGAFDWLICQDVCIPEKAEIALTLPVEATPRSNDAESAAIAKSIATSAMPLTGGATVERTKDGFKVSAADGDLADAAKSASGIRFFPLGPETVYNAPQLFHRGEAGVSVQLKASDYAKPGDQDLPGIIVISGGDGTLKSWDVPAKPGAAPAGVADTAVKAAGGAPAGGGDDEAFTIAGFLLALGAGFVGGMVLNLMPCVLPVLAVKAAGLAATAHDPKESRAHGLAYLAGILVCFAILGGIVVALKAAGEFAGFGFQLQYAPVTAFFTLAMFALGLNLLGVFEVGGSLMGVGQGLAAKNGTSGAFFSGALAAFVGAPCVGPFMASAAGWALQQNAAVVITMFLAIGLGLAAPFVALSFIPQVAKIIPKPGKWMATFRQILAFPMFLTMLWLLWTLAGQTGANGVIVVVGGAIAVGFGIWLATKWGGSIPGRVVAGAVIVAAFLLPSAATASIKAPEGGESLAKEAGAEPWSVERVAQLQSEGRIIFVDFTARWCVTCQVNKQVAIDSQKARKAFEQNNVAFLVADWTNRDSVIASALAEHGRAGVPLYLVYPAAGGDPVVLPQVLTPGLVEKAVKDAAGTM
ncbi:MAG TPA: protein-disulfide reductase DsbD domain-containing protein [Hyphomonadaceae bacterium]|nr:protein-disulfide reductase DsbD domain-containing protein [Hyphomonadaceae bacterium]